jgi:hypothetical protein
MRPTASVVRRTLAGTTLLLVGMACSDTATEPGGPGARAPRFDVIDSTTATTTSVVDTTATTTTTAVDTTASNTTTSTTTTTVDTTVVVPGSDPAPQLLVCPTTDRQTASGIIGPDGGIVTARGATLTIPAGAVPVPTQFEVVVPASKYMETDIHAVGVDHYVFQSPVTITINYARCPSGAVPSGASLQGVYVDTATYQVLQQMGGVTYKSSHKVTFSTPHLSGYIVAY